MDFIDFNDFLFIVERPTFDETSENLQHKILSKTAVRNSAWSQLVENSNARRQDAFKINRLYLLPHYI